MSNQNIPIPSAADYQKALEEVRINDGQAAMLKAHFKAHNRSITYTDLAASAGYDGYKLANLHYGNLGKKLSEAVGFAFWRHEDGTLFYSSAIGQENTYAVGDFQLVTHHELAKAIGDLGWF